MSWRILEGDCVEQMQRMPEASVDAVVCDPPYHLAFMGREWDTVSPGKSQHEHERWAREALRVLKPGGHLLAFGGTRTYHRLAAGIEDAGFEIRDTIAWMYGSGFPKSLDVSKAIDKAAGAEREVVGKGENWGASKIEDGKTGYGDYAGEWDETTPATPEAQQWQGWGTALKPAHEPIVVARKPLVGTVAGNVLAHGTGAINVDGCRIEGEKEGDPERFLASKRPVDRTFGKGGEDGDGGMFDPERPIGVRVEQNGRWPANVALSPEAAERLDAQAGESVSRQGKPRAGQNGDGWGMTATGAEYDDEGGPSRYFYCAKASRGERSAGLYGASGGSSRFFYVAKASSAERNAGLDGFEEREHGAITGADRPHDTLDPLSARFASKQRNVHPTVKPIDLMRWLVRLVTPPGGVVLDPFTGSGTTGCAAMLEKVRFVGIEREAEYAAIARARVAWWAAHPEGVQLVRRLEAEAERRATADRGQLDLFG